MTSKLTRERIELIANFHRAMTLPPSHDEIEELARMALYAMDSEPVAEVLSSRPGNDTSTIDRALPVGTTLYRHAQQPVVPPMQHWEELCREYPDMSIGDAIIRAAWWNHCRAAMLQHQPQNAQQNIPENIPGGLVEAVNNLLNNDGSRGCYDAMECGTAREKIELWLAQRQRWEEQRKANLSAGNSPAIPDGKSVTASTGIPVIPDGYVMVPKEPTAEMIAAAMNCDDVLFNSDESFCVQFGNIYETMLAAAPQEVR